MCYNNLYIFSNIDSSALTSNTFDDKSSTHVRQNLNINPFARYDLSIDPFENTANSKVNIVHPFTEN